MAVDISQNKMFDIKDIDEGFGEFSLRGFFVEDFNAPDKKLGQFDQACFLFKRDGNKKRSRDNEVYPYQRTPMGNPYINPI